MRCLAGSGKGPEKQITAEPAELRTVIIAWSIAYVRATSLKALSIEAETVPFRRDARRSRIRITTGAVERTALSLRKCGK